MSSNDTFNALTALGALRALIDFTLSNARRFYSSMGNPLPVKGLTASNVPINALTAVGALRALTDFTLSNARRFYSSMGNPLPVKGLTTFFLTNPAKILAQAKCITR